MKPIKFTHFENGTLEFDRITATASMMQLGALHYTADRSIEFVRFASDLEGLESALEVADTASIAYAGHIQSLGQLMAYADKNIGEHVKKDVGWMLMSFGQNLVDLENLKTNLSEAINKAKEDAQKAAKKGGV